MQRTRDFAIAHANFAAQAPNVLSSFRARETNHERKYTRLLPPEEHSALDKGSQTANFLVNEQNYVVRETSELTLSPAPVQRPL